MIRQPVVAGQFYQSDPVKLRSDLDSLISVRDEKTDALGVISPHAGYMYSGNVMGDLFSRINAPDTAIILAPSHTGMGAPYSVWPGGAWITPLGESKVETGLVDKLVSACSLLEKDCDAHLQEHSAEVILPFLQYINPGIKIVVIVICSRSLRDLKEIGKAVSGVVKEHCPKALVVASSDMTHQEPAESAEKKDNIALGQVFALNEDGLHEKVTGMHITMCGVSPSVSMLACSKERGASRAYLTKYENSGYATGDYRSVVGYAGVIVQ